jgi:hypothetical protein
MALEAATGTTQKKYKKPTFHRTTANQVVLDLIERAQSDERLALILKESIQQSAVSDQEG